MLRSVELATNAFDHRHIMKRRGKIFMRIAWPPWLWNSTFKGVPTNRSVNRILILFNSRYFHGPLEDSVKPKLGFLQLNAANREP
jgi:hypothetical protein